MAERRKVVLVQLPIPPAGLQPVRGNVPLAAGYLALLARRCRLDRDFDIELLPARFANYLSDRGIVEAILQRDPWLAGFSCYLWNIERTLWIAKELKTRKPELLTLLGGPEITPDNGWVLEHEAVDFAAIGEGELTFVELLDVLRNQNRAFESIPGLHVAERHRRSVRGLEILGSGHQPAFRKPIDDLDAVSSPYLEGILDAAEERSIFLETVRGCVFKCKFCYYPKSYADLHFLSYGQIRQILEHGRRAGINEVVLLDPTLNQRKDLREFLRLLADANRDGSFTYFGELRGEGINSEVAGLLRQANFTDVEIGLQSIDPHAQDLMDRTNNLKAFERGAKAMLDAGINVKVDLIIGLPGDTEESVRRGIRYLKDTGLHSDIQVFNLAILPGTAFREEAQALGLRYQPRPPYYVLETPTMNLPILYDLMAEAMETFDTEFDPLPSPVLDRAELQPIIGPNGKPIHRLLEFDVDENVPQPPPPESRSQALCLWFHAADFDRGMERIIPMARAILSENPYSTLQVVLSPKQSIRGLTHRHIEALLEALTKSPTYLDRLHGLQAGGPNGSKRVVIALPQSNLQELNRSLAAELSDTATIAVETPSGFVGYFDEEINGEEATSDPEPKRFG